VRFGVAIVQFHRMLAAGIGIMNICSFRDRGTREDGIRRASGGKKRNIRVQFIFGKPSPSAKVGGAIACVPASVAATFGPGQKLRTWCPLDWIIQRPRHLLLRRRHLRLPTPPGKPPNLEPD